MDGPGPIIFSKNDVEEVVLSLPNWASVLPLKFSPYHIEHLDTDII